MDSLYPSITMMTEGEERTGSSQIRFLRFRYFAFVNADIKTIGLKKDTRVKICLR